MIPADVASRLRLVTQEQPAPPQAVTSADKLADALSDLVPGQRLMAEIQALLPNGTYRAMVAQRDVTLALPFSAKPGDSLELEVVESDGKLTLAFVANRHAPTQGSAGESVPTTLSSAGKLIGTLLADIDSEGRRPGPVPLNGNRPVVDQVPGDTGKLALALKEALGKSGMFYEAHQALWSEGKLPTTALLQEPQGQRSPILQKEGGQQTAASASLPGEQRTSSSNADLQPGENGAIQRAPTQPGQIPADLTALVGQQLDALASQNYVWQGPIWQGQQMHWEIGEDRSQRDGTEAEREQRWQTRLRLDLPVLGPIDALLRLHPGGKVELSLNASDATAREKLHSGRDQLASRLDAAGLGLINFAVSHGQAAE